MLISSGPSISFFYLSFTFSQLFGVYIICLSTRPLCFDINHLSRYNLSYHPSHLFFAFLGSYIRQFSSSTLFLLGGSTDSSYHAHINLFFHTFSMQNKYFLINIYYIYATFFVTGLNITLQIFKQTKLKPWSIKLEFRFHNCNQQ